MLFRRALQLGLTLTVLLAAGADARAVPVLYSSFGSFVGGDGPQNDDDYVDNDGVLIRFEDPNTPWFEFPPGEPVDLGFFDTTGTTADSPIPVSADFTLTILQALPTAGSTDFFGTLGGTLGATGGLAYLQFNGPLAKTIGTVTYTILANDDGIAGRVNIGPDGRFAIRGFVGDPVAAVPEPSTLAMGSVAGIAGLGAWWRRRRLDRPAA